MLNIDTKLISEGIAIRLNKILHDLISEEGRQNSDNVEIIDLLQIEGIMPTVDIENIFDSVNHLFLVSALETYGFKNDFIRWIKLLLKNQESCIINGGQTTNCFKFKIK